MSTDVHMSNLAKAVNELLADAREADEERRRENRVPFFGPASVLVEEAGKRRSYSCFYRDISPCGVGLLHNMELKPGEVVLTVFRKSGTKVCFRSTLLWCRPCGEGWFISGAKFLALSPVEQRDR
jgi:hypothetical protein